MTHTVKRWTRPDSYIGAEWPEHYSAGVGRHRDSPLLDHHNFNEMLEALGGEREEWKPELGKDIDAVLIVRESHWAVGWVEWIAIHESNMQGLQIARDLCERLNNYPILNEDKFSDLEWEQVCERWKSMRLRDRIELCREAGVSIFAARHDFIPQDDNGRIFESLRDD